MSQSSPTEANEHQQLEIIVKHNGKEYSFSIPMSDSIQDMKIKLSELTQVHVDKQKIITKSSKMKRALATGSNTKNIIFKELKIKSPFKFVLLGTPDSQIIKDPNELDDLPEVIDDLELDYFPEDQVQSLASNPVYLQRLKQRIDNVQVHVINPPRKDKKLCVLDIDYTILDCKHVRNSELPIETHIRPHVHEFLTQIYENFDIVFWSQTKWLWVESKLTEMGILTNPNYHINFVLDKDSMFQVSSNIQNKIREHYVKPLQFLYTKFPQFYNSRNTVHVDDLSRNFAMNPHNGIKIKAFKDCANTRNSDKELLLLAEYLNKIVAPATDVRQCNNRHWKKELKQFKKRENQRN
jgi:ubiquitin-like domain-containing CTD phosphatase 1